MALLVGFLVCLFCVYASHGQVFQNAMDAVGTKGDKNGCGYDWKTNLTCSDTHGQKLDIKPNENIPAFATCYSDSSEENNVFVCLANGMKPDYRLVPETGTRTKRFLSAFFLAAAAVNLIGDVVCLFVCKNNMPPPNQPPILHCPVPHGPQPVLANSGEETAVVSWTQATARDPEGQHVQISQQPSNYKSGRRYSEGQHSVAFLAVDSGLASATCVLRFEVKVIHCLQPRWPDHGELSCDGYSYGKHCSISCLEGYHLPSGKNTRITCTKSTAWTRTPDCIPNPCGTMPVVLNGYIACPHNRAVFGATCVTRCNNGYRLSGSFFVSCDAMGVWSSVGSCKDSEPPTFYMGICPKNMVVHVDSPNNTALVKWSIPEGTDNTGDPIITESNGLMPNTRLPVGTHLLRYNIVDKAGNVGQPCSFLLQVKALYCYPPSLHVEGASHMLYDCPDRYRYGAECKLSCKHGYPHGVTTVIKCTNIDKDANPPKLDWIPWPKDGPDPYCKEIGCVNLRTPVNGAKACDLWKLGRQCQIQCHERFDFSFRFPEVYVCANSTGLWKPHGIVPDCTRKVTPSQVHLMADVYYYTRKCNSSKANLNEIQTNFIKALNSSNFNALCIGEPLCKAENVNVTCGPITTRRKRDTYQHKLIPRSALSFAYVVQFELLLSLEATNQSANQHFATRADKLDKMMGIIQTEVDKGHFQIHPNDMHLEYDSLGYGTPSYKCPLGMKTRLSTGSCAGCPVGMFMSDTKQDCEACPIGSYQDAANSVDCKPCPTDTNTTGTGSDSLQQCRSFCDIGSYSTSGLEPCIKCDTDSFQPSKGQTGCKKCGKLTRTLEIGAASKVECQGYDIMISRGKGVAIRNITSSSSVLTITTWLFVRRHQGAVPLFRFENGSNATEIVIDPSEHVLLNRVLLHPPVQTEINEWTHMIITFEQPTRKLLIYKNGNKVHDDIVSVAINDYFQSGGCLVINADVQIRSFYILETKLTQSEIQHRARTCDQNVTDFLLSQDDIVLHSDAKLVVPSQCDAVNECSSQPCGSHKCVNKFGVFECRCSGGYTGKLCTTPPDFCKDGTCNSGGTCVSGNTNYTCTCPRGFHGSHCEFQAINGAWSEWSQWSLCSKTCSGGITMRQRRCDSPPPDVDGKPCGGKDNETKPCNTEKCPECRRLRRTYGLIIRCNDTEEAKRCVISCRPGLYFATTPLLFYECGRATGYRWTHQSAENPNARLPTCSNVKPPEQVSVSFEGNYNIDPCNKTKMSSLKLALIQKLQTATCVKSGSCTLAVSATKCDLRRRKKRSQPTSVSITLSFAVDGTNLETTLEMLLVNKTAHTNILKLLSQVSELEKTAQEIYNNSGQFFLVTVGGRQLNILSKLPLPVSTVVCPVGSIKLDIFCAVVPQGSYLRGTSVIPCSKGEYQDVAGQTHCKQCPRKTTTLGEGSTEITDCIPDFKTTESYILQTYTDRNYTANTKNSKKDDNDPDVGVHVAVGVSVSVAVLILAVAAALVAYKYLRKRDSRINDSFIALQTPPVSYLLDKPSKA